MIIVKAFVFNSVAENTYVVSNSESKEAAIIDCGVSNEYEQEILDKYITSAGINPIYLLNTHMHFDHTWGNGFAANRWQLTVCTSRAEVEEMPPPSAQSQAFGMGGALTDTPIEYIEAGHLLKLGAATIKVLSVPGHSPGHLAFYIPEGKCVFTGDTLFREEIGRCDLWGGSLPTLLSSVRSELFTLPDDTIVYSGHGPESSIGHEKKYNPYFQ